MRIFRLSFQAYNLPSFVICYYIWCFWLADPSSKQAKYDINWQTFGRSYLSLLNFFGLCFACFGITTTLFGRFYLILSQPSAQQHLKLLYKFRTTKLFHRKLERMNTVTKRLINWPLSARVLLLISRIWHINVALIAIK